MEFSLAEWADQYLDYAKSFTTKTYKEKVVAFKVFFASEVQLIKNGPYVRLFKPEMPVTAIDRGMTLKHFQSQSEKRSGYSANKDRKNLLSAWNWGAGYIKGFPSFNPFLTKKFPEKRKPDYVPPERDFWKVYEITEGQDKLMLLTYLHTAARRTEIFILGWDDVDFGNSQIRLWTRKRTDGTLEFDWIPLTDILFSPLLSHKQKSTNRLAFPNPETGEAYTDRKRWMKSICLKAKVKPFGFHAIRHLTASLLAQAGIPAIVIQGILRHKKLSTTEKYLHRLTDLRPALTVLSGGEKAVKKPSTERARNFELKTI